MSSEKTNKLKLLKEHYNAFPKCEGCSYRDESPSGTRWFRTFDECNGRYESVRCRRNPHVCIPILKWKTELWKILRASV